MKYFLATVFFLLTAIFPKNEVQRKLISDDDFNYSFYVLVKKKPTQKISKNYYWYKSGEIHSSQGASSGNLLHGAYTKSYKNHDLAEQGSFNNGLKNKVWKKWFENGKLSELSRWKSGKRVGQYVKFSEDGKVLVEGNFKNNRRHGIWIDNTVKDTLYFKQGESVEKPKRYSKKPFKQRAKNFVRNLFAKKNKDSLQPSTPKKQPKLKKEASSKDTKKSKVRKRKTKKEPKAKKELN